MSARMRTSRARLIVGLLALATAADELPDYYNLLGVSRKRSYQPGWERLLKKAFRKQALRYHPDKNPSPATNKEALRLFPLINEAYETLKDRRTRQGYDFDFDQQRHDQDQARREEQQRRQKQDVYTAHPRIFKLTKHNYKQITKQKRGAHVWIVHFYSNLKLCPSCAYMETHIIDLALWGSQQGIPVRVAVVNADHHRFICDKYKITCGSSTHRSSGVQEKFVATTLVLSEDMPPVKSMCHKIWHKDNHIGTYDFLV